MHTRFSLVLAELLQERKLFRFYTSLHSIFSSPTRIEIITTTKSLSITPESVDYRALRGKQKVE